jgi:DNA polymerase-1
MKRRTSLHVLDGTAALFRAYYAMEKLTAPDGREVGAVIGLSHSLVRLLRVIRPTHIVSVFDAGAVTFRNDLYPDYKANRGDPPQDLVHQFDLALDVVQALGVRGFRIPGYEADDLMATLAERGRKAGITTVLITPDKDVCQLVGPRVEVMDPKTLERRGPEEVRQRFGVDPGQLADLLALSGDSTDNIPGVSGVGAKTARALVQAFGGLDGIYENLEGVDKLKIRGSAKLAAKLLAEREAVYLYRDLVRLQTEAPLSREAMTLGMLRYRGPTDDADQIFERLGFVGPLKGLRRQLG